MLLKRFPQARAIGLFNRVLHTDSQFIGRRTASDCLDGGHCFARVTGNEIDEEFGSLLKARERNGAQQNTTEPRIDSSVEAREKRSESFVGPHVGEGKRSFGGKIIARLECFGDEGDGGRSVK